MPGDRAGADTDLEDAAALADAAAAPSCLLRRHEATVARGQRSKIDSDLIFERILQPP